MRTTRRGLLGAGAALATASIAWASEREIAEAELSADIDVLKRAWLAIHPGLYRYQTPQEFDAHFVMAQTWARRPRSLAEFYIELARLSAALRCGHTYPNPSNQGRSVRAALLERPYCVPFAFQWLRGRMIVTAAAEGVALQPGDEVRALDGVSVQRLLRQLLPLMRADGGNDAKRVALAEVGPDDNQSLFDLYRSMLHPSTSPSVQIATSNGEAIEGPLMTIEERSAALSPTSGWPAPWRFALDSGVGRLTMPTWALYNVEWDWRGFLEGAIDELIDSRAHGLIIDLRGNEGGQDAIGRALLSRLISAPVTPPRYRRRVRYRQTPPELDAALTTWDQTFKNWGDRAVGPAADGFYDLVDEAQDDSDTIHPRGPTFEGAVATLIDAANSSATFAFARDIKAISRSVLVGETTGGSLRGVNGGAYFFLRLPNSRIELDLPIICYYPETPQPDHGITPHIHVSATRRAIRHGDDLQLGAALRDLERRRL